MSKHKADLDLRSSMILALILLALSLIVSQISDEKIKMNIIIILFSIMTIALLYRSYKDFKDKTYSTTIFIALTNIAIIILGILYMFVFLRYYQVTDINLIIKMRKTERILSVFIFAMIFLKNFLRSERFVNRDK
ncbi:hypothetical protein Curi_c13590 [Gottschalkia acidurici 9a]|uniref:Uncharacterized protein n=1 Tax=Gottschalkia acidurici (strain ATCC 7906 / DSM 604 / BCRC 14475 / CIP 104303 / KCTC 5404 / NCIMB 10678 / 9a) TaxID=1128398 RepID=K0AYN5_GOTA9|nr:hypothetical protein [Gottschalkia acidurici]AFS78369.1 hypothetical protein Curi_c13590 [Gottschalkia acidurici 9a]